MADKQVFQLTIPPDSLELVIPGGVLLPNGAYHIQDENVKRLHVGSVDKFPTTPASSAPRTSLCITDDGGTRRMLNIVPPVTSPQQKALEEFYVYNRQLDYNYALLIANTLKLQIQQIDNWWKQRSSGNGTSGD